MDNNIIGYEKAKEEHFDSYMKQSKQIHTWKIAFFISSILLILSLGITFYLTTRSSLIPYVIEVDATGNAKAINPAHQVNYIPTEAVKEYFLKEVIKNMRSVPRDRVLVGRNFSKNLFYLNNQMQNKYKGLIENEDLTDMINKKISRDVNIHSLTRIAGTKNSYQIRWEEKFYSSEGINIDNEKLLGIFTLGLKQPATLEQMNNNPIGILVEDFSITKEN